MDLKKRLAALSCSFMVGFMAVTSASAAETVTFGDINSDGSVNIIDLIHLKRIVLNDASEDSMFSASDLDSDGMVSASDAACLINFLLSGKIPSEDKGQTGSSEIQTEYPIDESAILEPKGTIHTGDGTFYGGGYEGGCAMLDPVSRDYWIVAMNLEDYADARLAGAYLEVTGELGTINMFVTDLLPEGKKGDLDLYTDAFPLIAPVEKGRVPVSWKIVPLDSAENAPVKYRFKEGSSPFWCGVQVLNHRYPITKLEYLNEQGEFVEIKRRPYNYFESREMGEGPFTFRVTDIYGQVIVDRDIPLVLDEVIEGKSQFPV